jgi:hypothetical protein
MYSETEIFETVIKKETFAGRPSPHNEMKIASSALKLSV